MKCYHFNEPPIVEAKSLEDVLKAEEDGRLNRIVDEHERYMKETGRALRRGVCFDLVNI
jgi:hypothetical protein